MRHNNKNNYTSVEDELKNKKEEKELFSSILGYDDVKAELKLIRSWYLDKKIQEDEKIVLPKGVIFYGLPGCGKTLFAIALAKSFNWPIVVIEGKDGDEVIKSIHDCFNQARQFKEKKAVIVIDEMDLLIDHCNSVAHALQTEIDGFNKEDSEFFVIATTNYLYDIPSPLKRPGRFDRLIEVRQPDDKNRQLLFEKFLDYYHLNHQDIDFVELNRVIQDISGADIKAICNDAYLRVGNNISTDELLFSYQRVINNQYLKEEEPRRSYKVAVHEAGHIIASLKNSDYASFHHATFIKGGAITFSNILEKEYVYKKNIISEIEISLAGMAAEKLINHRVDFGYERDMDRARSKIYKMVERGGFYGMKHYTIDHNFDRRFNEISNEALLKKEKLVYKGFKYFYKRIYKYLKKHKDDIIKVADFMYKNGTITYKDIPSLNLLVNQESKGKIVTHSVVGKPLLATNNTSENKIADDSLEDLLN